MIAVKNKTLTRRQQQQPSRMHKHTYTHGHTGTHTQTLYTRRFSQFNAAATIVGQPPWPPHVACAYVSCGQNNISAFGLNSVLMNGACLVMVAVGCYDAFMETAAAFCAMWDCDVSWVWVGWVGESICQMYGQINVYAWCFGVVANGGVYEVVSVQCAFYARTFTALERAEHGHQHDIVNAASTTRLWLCGCHSALYASWVYSI